nr:hypothetical protein [Cupriavidus basilensis]
MRRQHVQERSAHIRNRGQINLIKRGKISRIDRHVCRRRQQFGQGWQDSPGSRFQMDIARLQGLRQIDATQCKHQKQIAIDLAAQQVNRSRQVFARHGPIRAGAMHV